jgi:polyribonucleotide nucleotidyltransferase
MTKTSMKNKPNKIVNHLEQIPVSMTEKEAQTFWQTHQVGEGLLREKVDTDLKAKLNHARANRKSRNITLNLSENLEKRLRHLAELKQTSYQTLLKEFVLERVYEEEKRIGILGK